MVSTWNVLQSCDVPYGRGVFIFKFARTSIGAHMNIFYIIGVVVVVLVIAGLLGLRV